MLALKRVHCCWCGNPTTDTKSGAYAFNSIALVQRFPTMFIHEECAVEFVNEIADQFESGFVEGLSKHFYMASAY